VQSWTHHITRAQNLWFLPTVSYQSWPNTVWVSLQPCQLALWIEGLVNAHNLAPGGTTSENPPAPDSTFHQRKPVFKHPDQIPSKATSTATQPSILILRGDRDTEKAPVKLSAPRFKIRGKSPELLTDWLLFSFLFTTSIIIIIYLYFS
jgi:hypothetical protein